MSSFRFQSILFALVLLISVTISSSRGEAPDASGASAALAEVAAVRAVSSPPEPPIRTLAPRPAPRSPSDSSGSRSDFAGFIAALPSPSTGSGQASEAAAAPEAVRTSGGGDSEATPVTGQAPHQSPRHGAGQAPKSFASGRGIAVARGAPLALVPETAPRRALEIELQAPIAVAKELGKGEPYAAKGLDQRWPLASLVKLMTVLVATEVMPPETPVTITPTAVGAEGSAGGFTEGEVFTVRDLVAAALLASSNDAAEAIAARYGRERFVDAMQARARELGMIQTSYFDPTGISYLNQSTLEDQELLIRHLVSARPELLALAAHGRAIITEARSGASREIVSTHPFAGTPRFLGGKTGYTDEAYGNLLSLFRVGERTIFIGVMGSTDREADTRQLYGLATGG